MIKGICSFCGGSCGIELLVKDNKILEVRGDRNHPISKGYICPKGKALPEIVHSKERLEKPMAKDENGNWIEIEYKDAINIIVEKLKDLKDDFGPESLSIHTGEAGVRRQFPEYAKRFCQSYGTPNYSAAGSLFVERYEIWNKVGLSGEGIIGISPKIIESNQGIVEWKFISDIANAMGYEKDFPWNTEEEAIMI